MPKPPVRVLRLAVLLLLAAPLSAVLADPAPPELDDLWAGDSPWDDGGVIAVRWHNRQTDPFDRFWRAEITQIALPDGQGRMQPLENGPMSWLRPQRMATDFEAQTTPFLHEYRGYPFWCWPPVPDPHRDTHYLRMDLLTLFPPRQEQEEVALQRKEIDRLKSSGSPHEQVRSAEQELVRKEEALILARARVRAGRYRVQMKYQDAGMGKLEPTGAAMEVSATPDLFNPCRANNLLFSLLLMALILVSVASARRRKPFLKTLPALEAIPEAVRRAAALGRPLLCLVRTDSFLTLPTFASLSTLGEVSARASEAGARMTVPHIDPLVMAAAEELTARPGDNVFVTGEQFAFTAAVTGTMAREKPASCLYLGSYGAESLILAETGAASGAFQVAATDSVDQMPFLVTACDHVLIGEELFAASAALSGDPAGAGTLRAQDLGKALLAGFLLCGAVVATGAALSPEPWSRWMARLMDLAGAF